MNMACNEKKKKKKKVVFYFSFISQANKRDL